ncbi:MAG TPA: HlyD family secretion protein [Stellaceae bacterium]|jgi:membrane fusion protein (multidrug efflux system)
MAVDEKTSLRTERADPPIERKGRGEDRSGPAPAKKRRRSPWLRKGLFLLLPLALIGGGYVYVSGGKVMSTDDAYVEADKVGISTDVGGIVKEVDVTENQRVAAGQILYRLDPAQFQIALQNAKANLATIALTLDSEKAGYPGLVSNAAAQQAQVELDQLNYNRNAALLPNNVVSRAAYDQTQFTLQADKNKLDSSRQLAAVQLAKLGGDANTPTNELPQYQQAAAQVAEAQRELDHTTVHAPFSGIVTQVSATAPGKYLAASTPAFYLVDTDHVWVDAQPKETQLTWVRQGQTATIAVDTYPHVEWHGTLETISPAASQEFALLPAQNTSGNWVKVVQRVPMRLRVDTSDPKLPPLRAGMSVEVDVDTGHARGLPHFIAALFGAGNAS